MSIVVLAATATTMPTTVPAVTDDPRLTLVVAAVYLLVGLGIAAALGVFRRGSVKGPPRLVDPAAARTVGLALLLGIVVWFGGQIVLVALTHGQADVVDGKMTLSAGQFALLSTVPGVAAFLTLLLCGTLSGRGLIGQIGYGLRRLPAGVGQGLLAFLAVMPLMIGLLTIQAVVYHVIGYQPPTAHQLLLALDEASGRQKILIIAGATVVAPVFEELFFRGHLQSFLRRAFDGPSPTGRRWAPWAAILCTSVAFAVIHEAWTAPAIFALAIGLGYAYERTGNLWTSITIHALFNTTSTALFLAGVAGR